ncbi:MAG: hypothetical protein AB7I33_05640 [Gemmatimonadales bacterium]
MIHTDRAVPEPATPEVRRPRPSLSQVHPERARESPPILEEDFRIDRDRFGRRHRDYE